MRGTLPLRQLPDKSSFAAARSFRVFCKAQTPCSAESAFHDILGCGVESNVSAAGASPAAGYGQENIGGFGDKCRLVFGIEHEVAITLSLRCESRENSPADPKVGRSHMGAFFG